MSIIQYKADEMEFDFILPLIIIGGGACGLVAGLVARALDIETLILERDDTPTGSTQMSSGFIPAAETRYQKALGVMDSAETMAEDIQNKNHHQGDIKIVDTLTKASGKVIDWLGERHNIPFELVEGFLYPGHSQLRMHCTPRKTGEELMTCLLNAANEAELDILTQARVRDLYVDENSVIKGVNFERPDGSVESVGCEALILACNGFGGNHDMLKRFIPDMQASLYHGHEGNTGDAVLWGEKLGASLLDMGAYQGHGSLAFPHQTLISWSLMMQGGIQINSSGERFSNEHQGYSEQAALVLAQPQQIAWNIYDHSIHQSALSFEDYRNANDAGAVKCYASLEELAEGLGLPLANLEKTFADLASVTKGDKPDAFGRHFNAETALQAPYYAIKVTGALFHTQGGLEVDQQARVVRENGECFSNLYAAGGAARGVSGSNGSGYLSGNGLLSAVVLGAIAGKSASMQLSENVAATLAF